MGQFAEQSADFSLLEGGGEFAGVGEIGGINVPVPPVFEQDTVAIEAGVRVGPLEVAGEAGEVLGGEGGEGEGAVDVRACPA